MEKTFKPYSVKMLVERLKTRGLDLTEEAAMILIEELEGFVIESAELSPNPYDDVLKLVMPQLTKKVKKDHIDRINGKVDVE